MEPVATRTVRWSYRPNLNLIGTTSELPVDEARNWVAEGRATYVDIPAPAAEVADTATVVATDTPAGDDPTPTEARRHRNTKTE